MINIDHIKRKYERRPLANGRYFTPAGAKDIKTLVRYIEELESALTVSHVEALCEKVLKVPPPGVPAPGQSR